MSDTVKRYAYARENNAEESDARRFFFAYFRSIVHSLSADSAAAPQEYREQHISLGSHNACPALAVGLFNLDSTGPRLLYCGLHSLYSTLFYYLFHISIFSLFLFPLSLFFTLRDFSYLSSRFFLFILLFYHSISPFYLRHRALNACFTSFTFFISNVSELSQQSPVLTVI